jgi:putative DNA-invertase from lambdoid prophage Rac
VHNGAHQPVEAIGRWRLDAERSAPFVCRDQQPVRSMLQRGHLAVEPVREGLGIVQRGLAKAEGVADLGPVIRDGSAAPIVAAPGGGGDADLTGDDLDRCDRDFLRSAGKPPLGLKHLEQHGEAQPRGAGLVPEQHAVERTQHPTLVDILTCPVDHSYGLIAEYCPNQAIVCLLRPAPKQEQGFASRRTGRVQLGQRAALYCRVSTADQSCARQERELTAFAARAGYEVVGTFKETGSGVRLDRAERRKVMALAQARRIDAVLVTELSRWGRSTTDLLATLKELEARRVSVVALNGMTFDLATPHGRMMATMLAGIAEFERELIQERIRSGIAAAKARGKRLGRQPGQRPKSDRLAPQVLALVAKGRSYRLIGREVGLSKNTVAEIVKRRRATAAQTT